jgi:hypothetical protein
MLPGPLAVALGDGYREHASLSVSREFCVYVRHCTYPIVVIGLLRGGGLVRPPPRPCADVPVAACAG